MVKQYLGVEILYLRYCNRGKGKIESSFLEKIEDFSALRTK